MMIKDEGDPLWNNVVSLLVDLGPYSWYMKAYGLLILELVGLGLVCNVPIYEVYMT